MDNYLIIHISVNIEGKDYGFLYTFNPYSYDNTTISGRIAYLKSLRSNTDYNKNYQILPKSVNTNSLAKEYALNIIYKNYENKHLYVPQLSKGFPVNNYNISSVDTLNSQKLLYSTPTPEKTLIINKLGKPFLENLQPTQILYIANVKVYVNHLNRSLKDRFGEFCIGNKKAYKVSLERFMNRNKTLKKSSRGGKRNKNYTQHRK